MMGCGKADQKKCMTMLEEISQLAFSNNASRLVGRITTMPMVANTRSAMVNESIRILRGIRAHLDEQHIAVLRVSPEGLRSFMPEAHCLKK